mmetsp:Transcript_31075/g.79345  ORF Transcript_31075/g.79345 Transcript_31075/m.79345 type:complete len:105 (-) Transcript_31075:249-563(-)
MPPKGDGVWVAGVNDKGRFVVAKGADPAKPGQTAHQKVMKDNNIAIPLTQGKFAPTGGKMTITGKSTQQAHERYVKGKIAAVQGKNEAAARQKVDDKWEARRRA